jgi:hypothetical protein
MIKNLLFIGNSHTDLHYMPQMLWELVHAGDSGFELNLDQITGEDVGKEFGSRKAEREMKRHGA